MVFLTWKETPWSNSLIFAAPRKRPQNGGTRSEKIYFMSSFRNGRPGASANYNQNYKGLYAHKTQLFFQIFGACSLMCGWLSRFWNH